MENDLGLDTLKTKLVRDYYGQIMYPFIIFRDSEKHRIREESAIIMLQKCFRMHKEYANYQIKLLSICII